MSDRQKIILLVQGGCGDVIAATPMIRSARKTYPEDEIIVLCTYERVLRHNHNIDKLISLGDQDAVGDFFSREVKDKRVRYFKKFFPYDHIMNDAAHGAKNLPHFIARLYGFEENFDNGTPDYYVTDYEKRAADTLLGQDKKPVVLLHIQGAVPSDGDVQTKPCGKCGGRGVANNPGPCNQCGGSGMIKVYQKTNVLKDLDPKIVSPLVMKYKDKYNFLQIGLEYETRIEGAFDCLGMPLRDTIALFQHPLVKTAIVIESLFMHAAAALEKPVITVFQNTDPDFFGYPIHKNISDSGGCVDYPCNRPVGALLDLHAGYKNPKQTKSRGLWECRDQKCARMKPEMLEKAFLEMVEEKKSDRHDTLEEARNAKPKGAKHES